MGKLLLIIISGLFLLPASWLNAQRSAVYPDIPYQGKRVFIQTLKLGKEKKAGYAFQAIVINTGKDGVTHEDFKGQTVLLKNNPSVIDALGSLTIADLYRALGAKNLKLTAGTTLEKYSGWIAPGSTTIALNPPVEKEELPVVQKPAVENADTANTTAEIEEARIVLEDKKSADQRRVDKVKKAKAKKEKKHKKSKPESNTEVIAETIPEEKIPAAEPEETEITPVEDPMDETVETSFPAEENVVDEVPTVPDDPQEGAVVAAEEPIVAENDDERTFENSCSDIQIDTITVLRKSKNSIVLSYTLKNTGFGPATLKGISKGEDNLALRAHLCSTDRLTRGAITLGGSFIKVNEEEAILAPGASYQGELKLPLYKLTKFTPYLVIQVDPYQKIIECDETNNVNFINLIPATTPQNSN